MKNSADQGGCYQNKFDSKAGTTARAIETLMGQYFD